jgi:hypothetical protein
VYGVLHDPIYKAEYAADLRKDFSRLPFKEDFWRWADWGAELMAQHLGFAKVDPWPLERLEKAPKPSLNISRHPKAILRAEPQHRGGDERLPHPIRQPWIRPRADRRCHVSFG